MLTVAKITTGSAVGYADYLDGRSQPTSLGDYYLKDGDRVEAPGRWATGSSTVGMDGAAMVTGEQLRILMDVRRPDTGEPLRRAGATGQVAALDATFSAPKSVSATWAVADPQLRARIEQAHEHAIDQALHYSLERVAMIRVRVEGEVRHARATDVIATSWRHTTARAVAGRAPDPQLHSHVLLHGAIRGDGRVVAIDSRMWLTHGRELGAAYRTELARGLHELGFTVRRGTGRAGRYFEIDGVPEELIDRWSSRHHQVRAAIETRLRDQEHALEQRIRAGGPDSEQAAENLRRLREDGRLTPAQDRNATVATRSAKQPLASHADLDALWRSTARSHVFTANTARELSDSRPSAIPDESDLARRLTEFDARFTAREARAVALEAGAGLPIEEALEPLRGLRAAGELLELVDGTLTTRQHRAAEQATVHWAGRLAVGRVPPIPEQMVNQAVGQLYFKLHQQGQRLTMEQDQAIVMACSYRQLSVIEGQAGTGKSTVLSAVAQAHQAEGRQIIITSTAAVAAHRLAHDLTDAGVKCRAHSTAGLHTAIRSGREQLDGRTTVIHDEAALASTREQQRLFAAVGESGARLIEVGDPHQSQPVGAGGLWPEIHAAADRADAHRMLTRNVRARDPDDRREQQRFRDGETQAAVAGYHARGRVRVTTEQTDAEDEALAAAQADRRAGRQTLVLAQTSNEQLDALNARAQALRRQDGHLHGRAVDVPGRPYALQAGDEVQIRRTLNHPGHSDPIHNGSVADVQSVGPDVVHLALESHGEVVLDRDQLRAADVRLAYVQHPFPAQGVTSDTAHMIVAEHATQEGSYVALTRARDRTTIYAARDVDTEDGHETALTALAERMSRIEPEVPSLHVPLAHEAAVTREIETVQSDPGPDRRTQRDDASDDVQGPRYLTDTLGPRPSQDDASRPAWDAGARAITQHRTRYQVTDDAAGPLGNEPPAGRFRERHDYHQAQAAISQAQDTLGWTPEPGPEQPVHRPRSDRPLERHAELDGYEP